MKCPYCYREVEPVKGVCPKCFASLKDKNDKAEKPKKNSDKKGE